jgi:hypothetical protein
MRQHTSWQQRRAGVTAILERIARDPSYREHLLDSPAAALRVVGGPAAVDERPEVVGYGWCGFTCGDTCRVTRRPK